MSSNDFCVRSAVLGAAVGAAVAAAAHFMLKSKKAAAPTISKATASTISIPPRGQPVAGRPVAVAGVLNAGRVAVITGPIPLTPFYLHAPHTHVYNQLFTQHSSHRYLPQLHSQLH